MEGPERRFVKFGGGASDAQLGWLRQTLAAAVAEGQRVILCCHLALHPDTCPGACLLWNYQDVLEACWQAGNVVATFSGHAHEVLHHLPSHLFADAPFLTHYNVCPCCTSKKPLVLNQGLLMAFAYMKSSASRLEPLCSQ